MTAALKTTWSVYLTVFMKVVWMHECVCVCVCVNNVWLCRNPALNHVQCFHCAVSDVPSQTCVATVFRVQRNISSAVFPVMICHHFSWATVFFFLEVSILQSVDDLWLTGWVTLIRKHFTITDHVGLDFSVLEIFSLFHKAGSSWISCHFPLTLTIFMLWCESCCGSRWMY